MPAEGVTDTSYSVVLPLIIAHEYFPRSVDIIQDPTINGSLSLILNVPKEMTNTIERLQDTLVGNRFGCLSSIFTSVLFIFWDVRCFTYL